MFRLGEEARIIIIPDPERSGDRPAPSGRYHTRRTRIPPERWPEVATLVAEEGLREAARSLGVSHETVRRVCRRVDAA